MEYIEEFEIHVDISDRDCLYDYVTCQKLTRPDNGKWDLFQLRKYGQVANSFTEDDENSMVRVVLMDKAIMDKKQLERRKKERRQKKRVQRVMSVSSEEESEDVETDDSEKEPKEPMVVNYRNEMEGPPRRVLPIFAPGEIVKGNLVLKLKKNVEASKLTLRFDGQAVVNIRVYHRSGYYDYTKEEKFCESEVLLWKKSERSSA